MILVFGGTTEGRKTVEELEDAGKPFYYSTKTAQQQVPLHHGIRLTGPMTVELMKLFCLEKDIRLIVDAAHPFAEQLHKTVAAVSKQLGIKAIRFERIFPDDIERVEWFDSFEQFVDCVPLRSGQTLLATTGVQTIRMLRPLERIKGIRMFYRILHRDSSIAIARQQGVNDEQLFFYNENDRLTHHIDAIVTKESGLTGGFVEKVAEAQSKGIRVFAIRRPATPASMICVDGEHGLRRMVERLLPDFYELHSGLTTGTCATASAMAAAVRLFSGEEPQEVAVRLPNGEHIGMGVGYDADGAFTVKDSGDDPDITNGIRIYAKVEFHDNQNQQVSIAGGKGVGVITLHGFDYPPGEAAINKVPREMIVHNVGQVMRRYGCEHRKVRVTIFVPNGKEVAERTFNPRLGIVGGISIVGVSGIVKPFSEEGFIGSIRKCMEVAKATGLNQVVINSGAKSERMVKAVFSDLPQQVFVEYGNYIGETIAIANELGIGRVTLCVMIGKAVKLAAGHLDTHSRRTVMNKDFICSMLSEAGCEENVLKSAQQMTMARELWQIIPIDHLNRFIDVLRHNCMAHCVPLLPNGELKIVIVDEQGKTY